MLAAEQAVTTAKAAAAKAAAALTKVDAKVDAAAAQGRRRAAKVTRADAVVAEYQARLDAFANASFRGARLTQLSVLLTADSPEDYLDQASSLDRVATDQQATLEGASRQDDRGAGPRDGPAGRADADAARPRPQRPSRPPTRPPPSPAGASAALDTGKQARRRDRHLPARLRSAVLRRHQLSAVAGVEAANMDAAQARQAEQAAQRDRGRHRTGRRVDYGHGRRGLRLGGQRRAQRRRPGIAVEAALSRQGLPYVWAADGPGQFDCSSLMMWAWQQAGVTIPRNSAAQAAGCPRSRSTSCSPGDLVTFYSPVSHVGMYVGDGKVLHASMPGVPIKVVPLAAAGPNPTGPPRRVRRLTDS